MTAALVLSLLACGTERWSVKTLGDGFDPSAQLAIIRTQAQGRAVAELRALTPPERWTEELPRLDGERAVVKLDALLLGGKLEDDEDLHLVIADEQTGATMVAEVPADGCLDGAPEMARSLIAGARKAVLAVMPLRPRYRKLRTPRKVTVTGVVFFDKLHGQTGVAPNGVELHPLLEVKFR